MEKVILFPSDSHRSWGQEGELAKERDASPIGQLQSRRFQSLCLLPASWIYKSLKFHCCFHLIRITKTHVWFRSMTSLLSFFSQTQILKRRKDKVYSPRPWFEVQDGESRASILCGASFQWIIHCANTRHQKGLGWTAQAVVPTASKVNCPFCLLPWEPGR